MTPVLCAVLLPRGDVLERREAPLLRWAKRAYVPTLEWSLAHPRIVTAVAAIAFAAAIAVVPFLGRTFLPPFSEGSATITLVSPPGTPLEDADALGTRVEQALLAVPEVRLDEPAYRASREGRARTGCQRLRDGGGSSRRPTARGSARRDASLGRRHPWRRGDLRSTHRPSHRPHDLRVSYQPDDQDLRARSLGRSAPWLHRRKAASPTCRTSWTSATRSRRAFHSCSSISTGRRWRDTASRQRRWRSPSKLSSRAQRRERSSRAESPREWRCVSPPRLREDRERLAALPLTTKSGGVIPLGMTARLRFDLGPNLVRREDAQRVALLTANTAGADITGAVAAAREALAPLELPAGYQIVFGGSVRRGRAQASATWRCSRLSCSWRCTGCSSSRFATIGTR